MSETELPTNVGDFDTYMFDTLIEYPDAGDHDKKRWVLSHLEKFLPDYRDDDGTINRAITNAAVEYIDWFNSGHDRRSKIRKVLAFIRERRGEEE